MTKYVKASVKVLKSVHLISKSGRCGQRLVWHVASTTQQLSEEGCKLPVFISTIWIFNIHRWKSAIASYRKSLFFLFPSFKWVVAARHCGLLWFPSEDLKWHPSLYDSIFSHVCLLRIRATSRVCKASFILTKKKKKKIALMQQQGNMRHKTTPWVQEYKQQHSFHTASLKLRSIFNVPHVMWTSANLTKVHVV